METRYPADHLAMYFRQYKVTAYSYDSLKLQGIKKIMFLRFFMENDPLREKFSKFCSEKIHSDTDRRVVFKIREVWITKNR